MKILANDGISSSGIQALIKYGFVVETQKIAQEQLIDYINNNDIVALLVRSATKVHKNIIDACPNLKLIGRGGVGMDNIDVEYAKKKGLYVINTPKASSISVGELVFAHLFNGVRFLYDSNREMPLSGDKKFAELKLKYAKGIELRGKTLGIIGLGRIGITTAKIALSMGIKVIAYDTSITKIKVELDFFDEQKVSFTIESKTLDEVLAKSDFVSLHIPPQDNYIIGADEFEKMKDGSAIINTARKGVIDEKALLKALDSGKLSFAGLDVFEGEPKPNIKMLMHPKISLTPHIGGSTIEAQDRIGTELANQINSLLK